MTEAEGDLLHDIKNQYWHDFSELVSSTLLLAPSHLRDSLEEMLQESSSVYGRNDVHVYEKDHPHPYILTKNFQIPSSKSMSRCDFGRSPEMLR